MPISYFSEREQGPKPRVNERITEPAWGGIVAAIITRIEDNSFGYRFPLQCSDGRGVSGCNRQLFALAIKSEVPDILWPLNHDEVPSTLAILEFMEFCHRVVAKAIEGDYHSFFGHSHLSFEREAGQLIFRQDINPIFARNGLVYEIMANGEIVRLAPTVLRESLVTAMLVTGDSELDTLLETARARYVDPDLNSRRESLEKLWDAWERLKTLEPRRDKKESVNNLLNRAATEPTFRATLETEAQELTRIGNTFRIRHRKQVKSPCNLVST